jgi:Carboxypeptidase regulatory-like domain/TonB-dependent Receptor Plug Domain
MTRLIMCAAMLVTLAVSGPIAAQETTSGSIQGTVVDAQGAPIPGATITLTSDRGARVFVTEQDGTFYAPFLEPAVYTMRVELSGFSAAEQKDIAVRLGQRLTLAPVTLQVGGLAEVIQVEATAPIIDRTSTVVGGILDSEVLKRLPVGRQLTDSLYLVPGVSDSSGVGSANPSITGASGLENGYVVDGVNIANVGYGGIGSYSIEFNSLGSGVTTDFVKETQVKTAGFEAEYGQATGGVVNVVTKSGSNLFKGSAFTYFQSAALEAGWKQLSTPNGTVNSAGTENIDYGVGMGGPILRDRLFFYGTFNPQFQTRTLTAPSDFPLASLGEVDRDRRVLTYAGKATYQAGTNNRFDFSAFGDPAHGENGPQRDRSMLSEDTGRFSELDEFGGHSQTFRYDGILSPKWLIEGAISRSTNTFVEIPSLNEHQISDFTVTPTRVAGGIGLYDSGQPGKNIQFSAKSTNILDWNGSHQLRYGITYEDISFTREINRTGPTFTLPDGVVTRTGASLQIRPDPVYGTIYRVVRANFGPPAETTQQYLNFFVQDTWQLGRLTLRPGVRYEQQELVGGDPPLCHADDSQPGLGDGTGPATRCRYKWDGNWAPRIGAVYDLVGNGKSKLYANYGHFYVKIPNDLAARALSADSGVTRVDYFDRELTRPVPDGVEALGVTEHFILAGLHAATFDPDAKASYQREFLTGFEYELFPSTSVGIRYIRRDTPRILEDIGTAQMVLYDLGTPGLDSVEYFITNVNSDTPTLAAPAGVPQARFEDPEHKYQAVETTITKLAGNWTLTGSYRWSKLQGNYEGFYRSDNDQSDPAITSLFDFPTDDPSYSEIGTPEFGYQGDIRYLGCSLGCGLLPNNRTHQVKLFGSYLWKDLNVGMGFTAGSGRPLTDLAANPNYDSSGEIPRTVRGAGFETVDGFRDRSPSEVLVNAHVDYALKFGGRQVMLIADAFNLFNNQEATNYENCSEEAFATPNANFGQPVDGCEGRFPSFLDPFKLRLGVRFEW